MKLKEYEYTWMWEEKEPVVKAHEFFLDVVRSVEKHVFNSGDILYVGVTLGPKLLVGVRDPSLYYRVLEITGLSPHDVLVQKAEPFMMFQTCTFRSNRYRPLLSGVDIGLWDANCGRIGSCTLGFIAVKGTQVGGVTNNHCACGSVCGYRVDRVTQPGPHCGGNCQSDYIGPGSKVCSGPEPDGTWTVDGAFVPFESGIQYEVKVLDEGGAKKDINGPVHDPKPGDVVYKYGRGVYTNSTRKGQVKAIGVSVGVSCGIGGPVVRFRDQILMTYMLSPGDSGSGLFDENTAPVGLNFAGSSFESLANRATLVEQKLGVKILTKGALPPIPSIPGVPTWAIYASLGIIAAGGIAAVAIYATKPKAPVGAVGI